MSSYKELYLRCEAFEKLASELLFAKPDRGVALVYLFNKMTREGINVPDNVFYLGKHIEAGRGVSLGEALELLTVLRAQREKGHYDGERINSTSLDRQDWNLLNRLIANLGIDFSF